MSDVCPAHGKVKYPSVTAATAAADYFEREDGTRLRVYKCPRCKKWHFSSRRERVVKS